jgi:cwf18 pre-mRNA splicing factor
MKLNNPHTLTPPARAMDVADPPAPSDVYTPPRPETSQLPETLQFRSYEPLDTALLGARTARGNVAVAAADAAENAENAGRRGRPEGQGGEEGEEGGESGDDQEEDADGVPLWTKIPLQIEGRLAGIAAGDSQLLDWGNAAQYSLAPKRGTWDLERDLRPQVDILERRTQRAVLRMLKAKVERQAAAEDEEMAGNAADDGGGGGDLGARIARDIARDVGSGSSEEDDDEDGDSEMG